MKMPTIVGILIVISREKFMLSWDEHEQSFITSGLDFKFPSWLYSSIAAQNLHYRPVIF